MGNGEADTPSKTPKSSSQQEQPPPNSPATVFPDWASFQQAYYNSAGTSPIPPPGFYHSPVASGSQGHPYMWGPQHIIPPYGTPPPYITIYPHGGIYPHPSIPPGSHPYGPYAMPSPIGAAEASVAVADGDSGAEVDGRTNESGKASGASANGDVSESGESGSEGSSEGSDAHSADASNQKQCHKPGETQNGSTAGSTSTPGNRTAATSSVLAHAAPLVAIPQSAIACPATTLNIGMECWGGSSASSVTPNRSKLPVRPAAGAKVPSRDGVPSDLWLQDEREIKRQKRKQSNRESARRSRLRKQAECEELAQRVGTLKQENDMLTEELQQLRRKCEKLTSENASLNEAVQKLKGKEPKVDEGPNQSDSNCDIAVEPKVGIAEDR